jgi:hypothetical protein
MHRAHRPRTLTSRLAPVLWATCAGLLYAACALDATGLSVGSTTSSASAAGGGGGTGGAAVTSTVTVTSATSSTATTSTSHTTGTGGKGEGGQGGTGTGGTGGMGGGTGGAVMLLWQAGTPAAGDTYTLPAWLTLESPGAGRTSQTGPSTIQSGFAANAARARSVDGMTWGLSLENARTNECFPSTVPVGTAGVWVANGITATNTANFAAGPDGIQTATRVQMMNGQYGIFTDAIAAEAGAWTWSMWVKRNDADTSYAHRGTLVLPETTSFSITTSTAEAWTRLLSTQMLGTAMYPTQALDTGFDARASANPAYDGNPVDVVAQFCQLEQGLYPSSAIVTTGAAGTRQADSLASTDVGTILHGGFFNVEIHLAPNYALTEIGPNGHTLLYFDLDDRLVVSGTNSTISLILGGNAVLSVSQLAWARNAEVIVKAQNGPGGASLSVTGDITGTNSMIAAGLPALSPIPTAVYILGSPTGSEECADLRYLQFN